MTKNLRVVGNSFAGLELPLFMEVSPLHDRLTFSGNRMAGSGAIHWKGQVYEKVTGWLKAFPQSMRVGGGTDGLGGKNPLD